MAQARLTRAEKIEVERKRMREILRVLKREYPEAECSLSYRSPYQLLVATILSAQCTDERVNMTTPALFSKFGTPEKMAAASLMEIEKIIKSTGFFRSKAKSLQEASREIVEKHGGKVPNDLESLTRLRGVGRKTANVVLGNVFNVPSLVVDTHVGRISRRLGFTRANDPVKVEFELHGIVPEEDWTDYAHLMIAHGRKICIARRPLCEECPISRFCPKIGVPKP